MRNLRGDGAYPRQYQAFAKFHLRVRQSGLFRREKKFPRRPLYPARAVRDAVYGLQRGQLQQHVRPRGQRLHQARSEGPAPFGGQLPRGGGELLAITNADRGQIPEEDVLEYYTAKAGALIDNIDMLANWCMYRATAEKLNDAGLTFMTERAGERRSDGRKYRR